MNNVALVGRLTKDPDLRYTPNGVAVATFTLAVPHKYVDDAGNRGSNFINCVIWRKQAENMANYIKKGHRVGVSGEIQSRNYENQNNERVYVTEVLAENVTFLDKPQNNNGNN
ncbi:single-stranded DNA-binding protein (plasmid) [Bacillus paranthracis]|uniref:Single-stranded DNA-binding protein n=1 Tax=Bacillus phage Sato TaxID=1260286 RepID=A0A8E8PBE8_9VIRU|nr:single-stranded DNA-binding protein [Bacillus phage Sato]QPA42348.1 single-stranded DNA-binding protein [Bacillus paranthracis]QPA48022.1 single-stranded DNA-binding protein [Bacillus cereus]QWE49623.1 single-stranded DNA-binding protein [Bacillus phage Sato]